MLKNAEYTFAQKSLDRKIICQNLYLLE